MPNKLYEYAACGLPAVTLRHRALSRLVAEQEAGHQPGRRLRALGPAGGDRPGGTAPRSGRAPLAAHVRGQHRAHREHLRDARARADRRDRSRLLGGIAQPSCTNPARANPFWYLRRACGHWIAIAPGWPDRGTAGQGRADGVGSQERSPDLADGCGSRPAQGARRVERPAGAGARARHRAVVRAGPLGPVDRRCAGALRTVRARGPPVPRGRDRGAARVGAARAGRRPAPDGQRYDRLIGSLRDRLGRASAHQRGGARQGVRRAGRTVARGRRRR